MYQLFPAAAQAVPQSIWTAQYLHPAIDALCIPVIKVEEGRKRIVKAETVAGTLREKYGVEKLEYELLRRAKRVGRNLQTKTIYILAGQKKKIVDRLQTDQKQTGVTSPNIAIAQRIRAAERTLAEIVLDTAQVLPYERIKPYVLRVKKALQDADIREKFTREVNALSQEFAAVQLLLAQEGKTVFLGSNYATRMLTIRIATPEEKKNIRLSQTIFGDLPHSTPPSVQPQSQ